MLVAASHGVVHQVGLAANDSHGFVAACNADETINADRTTDAESAGIDPDLPHGVDACFGASSKKESGKDAEGEQLL